MIQIQIHHVLMVQLNLLSDPLSSYLNISACFTQTDRKIQIKSANLPPQFADNPIDITKWTNEIQPQFQGELPVLSTSH